MLHIKLKRMKHGTKCKQNFDLTNTHLPLMLGLKCMIMILNILLKSKKKSLCTYLIFIDHSFLCYIKVNYSAVYGVN